MGPKSEQIAFLKQPSIEHIMPQSWAENWRLADGSKGVNYVDLLGVADSDPIAMASRTRSASVQTLGNLTILTSELNAAQSNLEWMKKRPEMMKHSLLPINQALPLSSWDEVTILERGRDLYKRATSLWPR